ncbi:hypothetical protein M2137_000557 [Parabacteroides sp. PFB2-10]|nr:hypothetical protein [Parabacteroides sp. PFB2-10]
MKVLLTNPYVKKCFSQEFVFKVPLFCAQSPSEITNRKLDVSLEMGNLTFVYITANLLNRYITIEIRLEKPAICPPKR